MNFAFMYSSGTKAIHSAHIRAGNALYKSQLSTVVKSANSVTNSTNRVEFIVNKVSFVFWNKKKEKS